MRFPTNNAYITGQLCGYSNRQSIQMGTLRLRYQQPYLNAGGLNVCMHVCMHVQCNMKWTASLSPCRWRSSDVSWRRGVADSSSLSAGRSSTCTCRHSRSWWTVIEHHRTRARRHQLQMNWWRWPCRGIRGTLTDLLVNCLKSRKERSGQLISNLPFPSSCRM